ncbi:MAG: hypothetical protein Q9182_002348 [Xanthomendoza sp. 2 TL-2023]
MSLRHKFSRMFVRNSDSSAEASDDQTVKQFGHRKFNSETAVKPSVLPDTDPQSAFSPRKLHKAASTTFQIVSDSLRSKAQAFYVGSSQTEHATSKFASPEPTTPKKSDPRPTIWSSVRSRGSRSTPRRKLPSQFKLPETPTKEHPQIESSEEEYSPIEYTPIGDVPELTTTIPDPSLQVSQHEEEVNTPAATPTLDSSTKIELPVTSSPFSYGPRQLWPTPHMRLRQMKLGGNVTPTTVNQSNSPVGKEPLPGEDQEIPIEKLATSIDNQETLTPINIDVQGKVSAEAANDSASNHASTAGVQTTQALRASSEDIGNASDTETIGTRTTYGSTPRTSVSGPLLPNETASDGRRVFDTDRKLSGDIKGTFWPATKVLKSSKRSPSGCETPPLGGVERSHARTEGCAGSEPAQSEHQRQVPQNLDPEAGETSQNAAKKGPTHLSSEVYQADTEGKPASPQPSMGPRNVWDEAQADRRNRHEALQLAETATDSDSDFGEELTSVNHRSNTQTDAQLTYFRENVAWLRGIPATENPEASENRLITDLEGSSKPSRARMTKSVSSVKLPAEVYKGNRDLRLALHERGTNVTLFEEGEEDNESQNIVITSRLDPEDPFEKMLLSAGYARRALQELEDSKANAMPGSSEPTSLRSSDVEQLVQQYAVVGNGTNARDVEGEEADMEHRLSGDGAKCYDGDIEPEMYQVSSESSTSVSRGRSKTRSSSSTLGQRDKGKARKSSTSKSKYPQFSSTPKGRTNHDGEAQEPEKIYTTFDASSDQSGSPSNVQWLRRHHERVDDYVAGEKEKDINHSRTGARQRLADVSMVERRRELERRANHEALCQFIYRCEQLSQEEADAESLAEKDEGYTAEMFE